MKKILLISLIVLFISGCSDDNDVVGNTYEKHELVGVWDRRDTYENNNGEFINFTSDVLWIFSENGIFSYYVDGDQNGTWDYDYTGDNWWTTDNYLMIDGSNETIYEYEVSNNILVIKENTELFRYTFDKQ